MYDQVVKEKEEATKNAEQLQQLNESVKKQLKMS